MMEVRDAAHDGSFRPAQTLGNDLRDHVAETENREDSHVIMREVPVEQDPVRDKRGAAAMAAGSLVEHWGFPSIGRSAKMRPGFDSLQATGARDGRQGFPGTLLYSLQTGCIRGVYVCYSVAMSNQPQIDLPPGFGAETQPDGTIKVRKMENVVLSKGISFRLTTEEHNKLLPFAETFLKRSWSDAFRWLLDQPGVQGVMADRIAASLTKAEQ